MKNRKNTGVALGRPRIEVTPELEAKVLGGFRGGHYHDSVAAQAGISPSHLRDLMNENPEFMARVKEATVTAEQNALQAITDGEPSWQSRAWFLERRYPRWRSPEVKLKAEIARQEQERALTAAPPTQQTWTLAEI